MFLGCPGYPDCKYIHKAAPKTTGVKCAVCKEGDMIEKNSKKGVFYSCSRYPECKSTLSAKPVGRNCPLCESPLIERVSKGDVTGVRCSSRTCKYDEDAPETVLPAAVLGEPDAVPLPTEADAPALGDDEGDPFA